MPESIVNSSQADQQRLIAGFEKISHAILDSLDLDRVLDTLAVEIVETGIFRSLMIALVDDGQKTLHVVRSVLRVLDPRSNIIRSKVSSQAALGHYFDLATDPGLASEAARTGKILVIEGWDDRYGNEPKEQYINKIAYYIPVMKQNKVLAVLGTGSTFPEKEDVIRRIEFMQPFLAIVAAALTHARTYQQLLASQALVRETERLKVLMETAGAAAHEINQPLQSIVGFSEMLLDNPDQVNRVKMLETIMLAATKISHILKNMLDIRQYQTKAYVGDHEIVDLERAAKG
ncbi:MAG: GAF domain-containing protein [bacterium]|nr:GAF domain-containing protein [bacterium]